MAGYLTCSVDPTLNIAVPYRFPITDEEKKSFQEVSSDDDGDCSGNRQRDDEGLNSQEDSGQGKRNERNNNDAGHQETKLCQICWGVFESQEILHSHIQKNHFILKLNNCDMCSETFSRETQLKAHVRMKHGPTKAEEVPDKCPEPKAPKRKLSTEETAPSKKQVCVNGAKETPLTGCRLKTIVVKLSNDEGEDIIDIADRKKIDKSMFKFRCDFCKKSGFNEMSELVKHQDQVHVMPNIKSDTARKNVPVVNDEKAFFTHEKVVKIVDNVVKTTAIESKKYTCDDCGAGFNFFWRLEMHQVFVHLDMGDNPGDNPAVLTRSSKVAENQAKEHRTEPRNLAEGICDEPPDNLANNDANNLTANSRKPKIILSGFVCPICPYKATFKGLLQFHYCFDHMFDPTKD